MGKLIGFFTGGTTWMWAAALVFAAGVTLGGTGAWRVQAGRIAQIKLDNELAEADRKDMRRLKEASYQTKKDVAYEGHVKTNQANAVVDARVVDALGRMRNALADSRSANNALSSCVQRAAAIEELFIDLGGVARGIAKAADGHVADKVNCTAAWPH